MDKPVAGLELTGDNLPMASDELLQVPATDG
jgi:hypothetical protein